MAQTIRDLMTRDPVVLDADSSVDAAARLMKERDIGDVLVGEAGNVRGILTDRDIVVRVLAEGKDPETTTLAEFCTAQLHTLAPDDTVDQAVRLMEQNAIRRVPVVDGGRAVGIVSLGDLAVERDRQSALAEISAAPPNT